MPTITIAVLSLSGRRSRSQSPHGVLVKTTTAAVVQAEVQDIGQAVHSVQDALSHVPGGPQLIPVPGDELCYIVANDPGTATQTAVADVIRTTLQR